MRKLICILLLSLLSCGGSSDVQTDVHEGEIFGARFKEGKGIELSQTMSTSIGLETVEASEELFEGITEPMTTIPQSSLLTTSTGTFVYVQNGIHFLRTEVKVGRKDDSRLEITEGLYTGDVVVKSPVNLLWYAELQAIRGGQACADEH